jgi:hypothetical protein
MTAVAAFGFRQLATQMVGAMASAAGGRAKGPASVARFKAADFARRDHPFRRDVITGTAAS